MRSMHEHVSRCLLQFIHHNSLFAVLLLLLFIMNEVITLEVYNSRRVVWEIMIIELKICVKGAKRNETTATQ